MLRYCFVAWVGLCCGGPAVAATWADALFDGLAKDFGSVARGATLTHLFRLTNKTEGNLAITAIRTSCGCTTATALQNALAPGQTGVIVVQMDTRRFSGVKNVTVYVHLLGQQPEEVRLWVQANSRDDVTVTPDALAFGSIKRGSGPEAQVAISFVGGGAWQIQEAQCDSNYVKTSLKEIRKEDGQVAFQLTAHLRPDTPVGKWFTDVWLRTNHPTMPRVRVPLTVEVQSNLNLNPAAVVLGEVKVGGKAERRVILSGVRPFKVVRSTGTDDFLTLTDNTADSKVVHVLTISFKAAEPGEFQRSIRVFTDLEEDGEIEFQAQARVVP